jgi:hypothetical protein
LTNQAVPVIGAGIQANDFWVKVHKSPCYFMALLENSTTEQEIGCTSHLRYALVEKGGGEQVLPSTEQHSSVLP